MKTVAVIVCTVGILVSGPATRASRSDPPGLTYALTLIANRSPTDFRAVGAGICTNGAAGDLRVTALKGDASPAWSPNGRRLAFARDSQIFVRDADGRSHSIARFANHHDNPTWSIDGRWILFDAGAYGSSIYSVRPDGSDLRELTGGALFVFDEDPAWSPVADVIAFDEQASNVPPRLLLMDVQTREQRLVDENGMHPSWSPNGEWIAFDRLEAGGRDSNLYLVRSDGSAERRLTDLPGHETKPAWSPDGQWIAFTRSDTQGFTSDIALVHPDGTDLHTVRGSGLLESDVAWRPVGGKAPVSGPCALRGSSRSDLIRGTRAGELILGGGGADTVLAGGGADLVDGGSGADHLVGAVGDDELVGGPGRDRLVGGPGEELLFSADGVRDVVDGGRGYDTAFADARDRLRSIEETN